MGVDPDFSSKDVGESFPFEVIRERFLFERRKMKASALDLAQIASVLRCITLLSFPSLHHSSCLFLSFVAEVSERERSRGRRSVRACGRVDELDMRKYSQAFLKE